MRERRQTKRVNIVLPAWLDLSGQEEGLAAASTININAQGICLVVDKKLDLGQVVPLEIVLPTREKITVTIKVIWVREVDKSNPLEKEFRMGVKIVDEKNPVNAKFIEFYTTQLHNLLIHPIPERF